MFYLPIRFNIIFDAASASTGVNILVPRGGKTKIAQARFVKDASAAATASSLNVCMHELRTNHFKCNNFTPEASANLPKSHILQGIAHCVYSRTTPLFFRSNHFGVIPYAEYAYILNALIAAVQQQSFEPMYKWFGMYDLRVEVELSGAECYLKIMRNESVVHRILNTEAHKLLCSMLIESGLVLNVEDLLKSSGLSAAKINAMVRNLLSVPNATINLIS